MGPAACDAHWLGPINRYRDRVNKISAAHMPTKLACATYNSHATSVLQYIAQVLPLPRGFNLTEKGLLHKLFHIPNNSFPLKALHGLSVVGGPVVNSATCASTAARIRASVSTLTSWESVLNLLMVVAQLFAPTSRYLQGLYHADHFDRPPFVLYLLAAKTGSNDVGHRKDMKDDFNRGARRKIQAIVRPPHLHHKPRYRRCSTTTSSRLTTGLRSSRSA